MPNMREWFQVLEDSDGLFSVADISQARIISRHGTRLDAVIAAQDAALRAERVQGPGVVRYYAAAPIEPPPLKGQTTLQWACCPTCGAMPEEMHTEACRAGIEPCA